MADSLLAGLPRISRAFEEVRVRGVLALALAVSVAGWWLVQWRLDQPVLAGRTAIVAAVVAVLGGQAGWVNARRRLREGLADPRRPNSRVVYETRADGGMRRMRFSGAVFLTAMVVLMFDALAEWGGVTAGVIVGVAVAAGLADLWEARNWRRAERDRGSELYLLVAANALVASYGRATVYEVPPEVAERERELASFTL